MKKNIILVLDDTLIGRNILRNALEGSFFVIEAVNIKQAINLLKQNQDVMSAVLINENFDYEEFIKIDDSLENRVPVCLIFNSVSELEVKRAKEKGIDDYITKPYIPESILKHIENICLSNKKETFQNNDLAKEYDYFIKGNLEQEKDAFGSFRINFDKQIIENQSGFINDLIVNEKQGYTFKNIITSLANLLIDYDKNEFIELFSYSNIKENYKGKGNKLECKALFKINGFSKYLKISVLNISDEKNGLNTGLFAIFDKTNEYIDNRIQKVLYENEYDLVCVADLITKRVTIKKVNESIDIFQEKDDIPADAFFRQIASCYVDNNEIESFINKIKPDCVIEELKENRIYNVASFVSDDKMSFYQLSFKYLDNYKEKVLFYIENITAKKELDFVTDGLNYHGFLNRCFEEVKKSNNKYAIIYVNCINYKNIVEYVSVDAIIGFLKSFYDLISKSFLSPLLIGRSSSDNFWLLVDTEKVDFTKLNEFNNVSLSINDNVYYLNLRFGIYKFENSIKKIKSYEIDTFCERAKIAESSIAKGSSDNYLIFNETLRNDFIVKSTILNDIKSAVERKEISVAYQPIYDIDGKKIVSAEALIRWNHHQFGDITPGLFIPVIESTGYISTIDKGVINQVNEFLEELENENIKRVPISVNLSRLDFFDIDLVSLIKNITTSHNKYNFYMNYEVTESYNIDLTNNMTSVLTYLRNNKAQIYLDDFGDGLSSFKSLISSNFDVIKIYKGLVDGIENNKISIESIKAICNMAHQVGLKIIAEGVENEKQLKFLKSCKVDYIQGFIYGRPMSKDKFKELLLKR